MPSTRPILPWAATKKQPHLMETMSGTVVVVAEIWDVIAYHFNPAVLAKFCIADPHAYEDS